MVTHLKEISVWCAFFCILAAVTLTSPIQARESFRPSSVIIESRSGEHRFQVEIAETAEHRSLGLQYRKELPTGSGMLFDFKTSEPVIMWMKNTYISLDMLFISRDGTIVNIAERTKPLSLAYIRSRGPVKSVLEIQAGTAKTLGIRVGDKVRHEIFQSAD